jgi:spore maturation protein A
MFFERLIYMMNYIFGAIILISTICAVVTGRGESLAKGIIGGASESVSLLTTMAGMMMLWSGIMEIAERGGFTRLLGRLLSPALRLLFNKLPKDSEAMRYISMNVSANLLGLGNAATPFGISAVRELGRLSDCGDRASDDMIVFVVINTASIQIMPTMVGTLRQAYGSAQPFSILPCVWISSVCALAVGLIIAKLLNRVS